MKNKSVATLIAFFFGGVGIHHFYLGDITKGILYLCFSWTIIPSILGFIDFIMFVAMSEEEFDDKYNKSSNVTSANMGANAYDSSMHDVTSQLLHYAKLYEEGLITKEEYDKLKHKLLMGE